MIKRCRMRFFSKPLVRLVRAISLVVCIAAINPSASLAQGVGSDATQPSADYKDVIAGIQKRYGSIENVHIVMNIGVFQNAASTKPVYQQSVEIWRNGQNYLCRMNEQDMLMNEKYSVLVDKMGKEIICSSRNVGEEVFKDPLRANLDSLFSYFGRPAFIGRKDNIDHFRLTFTKGDIRELNLFVSNDSKLLTRVDYVYKDKQYARIDFPVFDTQPIIAAGIFDEAQYISITKNGVQPSKKMSYYRVVNAE